MPRIRPARAADDCREKTRRHLRGQRRPAALKQHHLQLLIAIARIAGTAFGHARYVEWLEGENERLKEESNIEHGMVGDSPRMRDVYEFIRKAGPAPRSPAWPIAPFGRLSS